MLNKYSLLILLISLTYFQAKAQELSNYQEIKNSLAEKKVELGKETPSNLYFNKDWQNGTVEFDNGKLISNSPIKYNVKKKNIEVKRGEKVFLLQVSRINKLSFTKTNESLVPVNRYDLSNAKLRGLAVLVHAKPNASLILNHAVKAVPYSYNSALTVGTEGNTFKLSPNYFFVNASNTVYEIEKSTKKNNVAFGDNWSEVYSFVKKNKLSFKKKAHIIKIVDFYSDLIGTQTTK